MVHRFSLLIVSSLLLVTASAFADDLSVRLTLRNQQFVPQQISAPADTKVALLVSNEDNLPMEFESYDLSSEVIVPGKGKTKIYIGPLTPGRYTFFNDFNRVAQGTVVVKSSSKAEE